MTENSALKGAARSLSEKTGEKYTDSLATVKAIRHQKIDVNSHISPEVLRSYVPLADLMNNGWKIADTSPSVIQVTFGEDGEAWGGTILSNDNADLSDILSEVPYDDVWELDNKTPLNECHLFFVGFDNSFTETPRELPYGEPPFGIRTDTSDLEDFEYWDSTMILVPNSQIPKVKLGREDNTTGTFAGDIAAVLNWMTS